MTQRPLRFKPSFEQKPGSFDDVIAQEPPEPVADVTPDPAPPLDAVDVPPLTDPDEPKGG